MMGSIAMAHGDFHGRIQALSREIAKSGATTDSYLQRAELWRLDGDFLAALADCTSAAKINETDARIHLVRGRIFFDQRKFLKVRKELDAFLEEKPDHQEARLIRAKSLAQLGDIAAARIDYTFVISRPGAAEPDTYFEFAKCLHDAGLIDDAIGVLEEGLRRLKGSVSLEILVINYETELRRFDAALHRLDVVTQQAQRKEKWLFRRGEIQEKAGRNPAAREDFLKADAALNALPQRLRMSDDSRQLALNIRVALARLEKLP